MYVYVRVKYYYCNLLISVFVGGVSFGLHFGSKKTECLDKSSKTIDILFFLNRSEALSIIYIINAFCIVYDIIKLRVCVGGGGG